MWVSVNRMPPRSSKPDQREPRLFSEFNRQSGGCRYGRQERNVGAGCLGYHFVAGATSDQHKAAAGVGIKLSTTGTQQLVQRVVAADIFTHQEDFSGAIAPGRTVHRAGLYLQSLSLTERGNGALQRPMVEVYGRTDLGGWYDRLLQ